ncbi:MAG: sugar phosphate nucleotidyltransferase [Salinivirgaceae bacterium]
MKPTLLILAAGMGSRYGGLKQLDQMGPSGETIMDYSVFDALRAGFGKVVFVIRRDFEEAFKERFIEKMKGYIEVDYVFQEMTDLPNGYNVPEGRTKPWGTNHAVWAARKVINEPFAVINADDFYGADAFKVIGDYLQTIANDSTRYVMVGYPVANTLSEHGTVNRGVCNVDDNQKLVSVTECEGISKNNDVIGYENENQFQKIPHNARVSMNMWGFSPYYFDQTETDFLAFLDEHGAEMKSEFYIPATVTNLIQSDEATVKVLDTTAKWFGVTYQEDKEQTTKRIQQMIKDGEYPQNLWS